MAAQPVAHHEQHIGQHQRRRAALLVVPAQRAPANDEFMLAEQPVGRARIGAARRPAEIEAGHLQPALRVAANFELRTVNQQLLEAQLERQQRARRQRRHHARQAQCRLCAGVQQDHVTQLEGRRPAARSHADAADANRHAERLTGPLFDGPTPVFDVGQNAPVQGQPGQQQQATGQAQNGKTPTRQQPQRAAEPALEGGRRRGWNSDVGEQGHERIEAPVRWPNQRWPDRASTRSEWTLCHCTVAATSPKNALADALAI